MFNSNCPGCGGSGLTINKCSRCNGKRSVQIMNHLERCAVCAGIGLVHRRCAYGHASHGGGTTDGRVEPYGRSTAYGSGIDRHGDNVVVAGLWGIGKPHLWSFGVTGRRETATVSAGEANRQGRGHTACHKCKGTGTYTVPCYDCNKSGWGNGFGSACSTCFGKGSVRINCYHYGNSQMAPS
jgi:hypothetical protein